MTELVRRFDEHSGIVVAFLDKLYILSRASQVSTKVWLRSKLCFGPS